MKALNLFTTSPVNFNLKKAIDLKMVILSLYHIRGKKVKFFRCQKVVHRLKILMTEPSSVFLQAEKSLKSQFLTSKQGIFALNFDMASFVSNNVSFFCS
ncbi:MAG: hypothetical protein ACYSSI_00735 [Planctomycetota bacterium]